MATTAVGATPRSTGEPARHGQLLRTGLVGLPPASLTVTIRGVAPGGLPWALARGSARLSANGRLNVNVRGLLISDPNSNFDGTTGPVAMVAASVTCEGSTPVSTATVPLSGQGDARINQDVTLPALCEAPIILIRANSSSGPWIAASGF
jgi:hypothetical protein